VWRNNSEDMGGLLILQKSSYMIYVVYRGYLPGKGNTYWMRILVNGILFSSYTLPSSCGGRSYSLLITENTDVRWEVWARMFIRGYLHPILNEMTKGLARNAGIMTVVMMTNHFFLVQIWCRIILFTWISGERKVPLDKKNSIDTAFNLDIIVHDIFFQ
jgi:hypothetical protein